MSSGSQTPANTQTQATVTDGQQSVEQVPLENTQTSTDKNIEYAGIKLSQIIGFRELLETVAKVLIGVSISSYIIGLLILNIHLRRYGVFHLGFAQFEYILAGMLWLFLVGIAFLVVQTSKIEKLDLALPLKQRIRPYAINLGVGLLFNFVALLFPISIISDYEISPFSWSYFNISIWIFFAAVVIDSSTIDARLLFRAIKARKFPSADMAASILFIIVFISVYSGSIYPKLSPVFGGGKQQTVILVVKSDQIGILNNLGMAINTENHQLGPIEIIYEDTDYFILTIPNEFKDKTHVQSIRLKKDMFDVVLQVDRKYSRPLPTLSPMPSPTTIPNGGQAPKNTPKDRT